MNFSRDLGENRTGRWFRFTEHLAPSTRAEAQRLSDLLALDKEYGKDWVKTVIAFVRATERRLDGGDVRATDAESSLARTRKLQGSRNKTIIPSTLLGKGRV